MDNAEGVIPPLIHQGTSFSNLWFWHAWECQIVFADYEYWRKYPMNIILVNLIFDNSIAYSKYSKNSASYDLRWFIGILR